MEKAANQTAGWHEDAALSQSDRNRTVRAGGAAAGTARQGDLFAGQPRSFSPPRPGDDRIGVVDVGSNSVRMVVFEGGRRCPAMVFNEKVSCGLGTELDRTGRLSLRGRERALEALGRFVALAPGLRVGALAGVATAAVREASDGEAFCEEVAEVTGIRLEIASGSDEARLAAQGVLFGEPDASGLVVDLGGASMELCPVDRKRPGTGLSTPLGPQRLGDLDDAGKARETIAETLAPLAKRYRKAASRLYLVGGAWRALGRAQIARSGHPLNVLHEYAFLPEEALITTGQILKSTPEEIAGIPRLPSGRVATMPYAALLLEMLIDAFRPEEIQISGFGLREGICYQNLPQAVRREDPLISTAAGQERTRARAPGFGRELSRWVLAATPAADAREERLIRAACHLADVSWRAHPDYRGIACLDVVTRVNFSSAGHRGRAFMLAALLSRYKGARKTLSRQPVLSLLSEKECLRAQQIGAVMRLGCTISGAVPGYLPDCPLGFETGELVLSPTDDSGVFMGEEVRKRLAQAARTFSADWRIGHG